MDCSGIYQIKNLVNNKVYIGESVAISNRRWQHFSDLKLNRHSNQHLQLAWNKYGKENFEHSILEKLDTKDKIILKQKEHEWCLKLNSYNENYGYNIRITEEKLNLYVKNRNSRREKSLINRDITSRNIYQIDINTNQIIKEWEHPRFACQELNLDLSRLFETLTGRKNKKRVFSYKGFVWIYKDKYDNNKDYRPNLIKSDTKNIKNPRASFKMQNIVNKEIREFPNREIASIELGIKINTIKTMVTNFKKGKPSDKQGWKIYEYSYKC